MTKFFDTCCLISDYKKIFKEEKTFYISSITLNELENIKSSGTKDEETKYSARQILRFLEANEGSFTIVPYTTDLDKKIEKYKLPLNNDSRIIVSAEEYCGKGKENVFVTRDLACKYVAKGLEMNVTIPPKQEEEYCGYVHFKTTEEDLANFYSDVLPNNKNILNLYINQYVLVEDAEEKIIDSYKWTADGYKKVPYIKVESDEFGKVTPKDNDPYQRLALDCLTSNQLCMLRGPAGSGKSYLAFAYMFDLLEKGKIDKIIVFCNTVATKDSAKLGFYPGDKNQKLLDSQIGNFLVSKLGSITEVEKLIDEGVLMLVPLADCRGMDTSGMNAAIYFTEAQNATIDMMKLMLQRVGSDCYCIIDGDDKTQVDMSTYGGANNGMRRISEVFKGEDYYGEITLQNCYRSKIAARAEMM